MPKVTTIPPKKHIGNLSKTKEVKKIRVAAYENDTFEQLLQERDCLIAEIHELEKIVYSEDRSDEAWSICPQPDVRYQMNLDYLSELCAAPFPVK